MRIIALVCIYYLSLVRICAGSCPTGPLVITSQSVIDHFAALYPGCTIIDVDIFIEGPDITNLHGLSHLTAFLGNVSISETSIITLDGLTNIRLAEVLDFFNNNQLVSLDGLDSLEIGRLTLNNNALINDLSSLWTAQRIDTIDFSFNTALTNLNGLDSLREIGKIFLSGNSQLSNVEGLKNIRVIKGNCSFINNGNNRLPAFISLDSIYGSLAVSKNKTLINLRGLDSLEYIGEEIFIAENDGLLLLTGLENLEAVYRLIISGNRKLINLLGISSLHEIENELFVSGNHSLTDLKGLDSIRRIGEDCTISGISLMTLNGLDNVDSIKGDFNLNYNYVLTNANGIKDLEHIGGDFRFFRNDVMQQLPVFEKLLSIEGDIIIQDNASLTSLHSFVNLRAMDGTLHISGHPLLTSLEGIDSINSGTIQNIEIYDNASLTICNVASLCQYFLLNRPYTIFDNQAGCNSKEEINAQCVVSTKDPLIENVIFHPNPANEFVQLELSSNTYKNISLYDTCGEAVEGWSLNENHIDISKLPPGMYIILLHINSSIRYGKILKM